MTSCCINVTVMRKNVLTAKNDRPTSLARASWLEARAHYEKLEKLEADASSLATKNTIDKTVQRLAKRTNVGYRDAMASRQADEDSWLLVRVLRYLTPRFSRSNLADLYTQLQNMDEHELSSFAQRYGWEP
jgi:hypothetical protein